MILTKKTFFNLFYPSCNVRFILAGISKNLSELAFIKITHRHTQTHIKHKICYSIRRQKLNSDKQTKTNEKNLQ